MNKIVIEYFWSSEINDTSVIFLSLALSSLILVKLKQGMFFIKFEAAFAAFLCIEFEGGSLCTY